VDAIESFNPDRRFLAIVLRSVIVFALLTLIVSIYPVSMVSFIVKDEDSAFITDLLVEDTAYPSGFAF
jgi:hypothetical protein